MIEWQREFDFSAPAPFPHPFAYLSHLAEALCGLLAICDDWARKDIMDTFRRRLREMDMDHAALRSGMSDEDKIRAVLSEDHPDAMHWAQQCIELGWAQPVDPDDLIAAIDRICEPVWPGCRARDD